MNKLAATDVLAAAKRLKDILQPTPLQYNQRLSDLYEAKIYLKREDLQPVRSYKIRGAYNAIVSLTPAQRRKGVVCASAGNHAQGVAWACSRLGIKATIFMPATTPLQKIHRVRYFGNGNSDIVLRGNTYDDAAAAAHEFASEHHAYFVHPFNDPLTIAGQGTVAAEILAQSEIQPDAIIVPVGGGGLLAGTVAAITEKPAIQLYGVEPSGAASMIAARQQGKPVALAALDTFVDGCAVRTVGEYSFQLTKGRDVHLLCVNNGLICKEMIGLYQNEGIITEPSGALSVAALEVLKDTLKGKRVACVISGGNNDLGRYPEIMERSLIYQGLKHYFLIEFSQRPGQLRRFVDKALGPTDDIVRFEYTKKNNKESGPALVGIELAQTADLQPLMQRMQGIGIKFRKVTDDDLLFNFLV